MLHPHWNYGIEKNWDYSLYPEVKQSNIFCYGRGGTGKTDLVAIPVLHNAIDEGRSCIIYAENTAEEYADIRERAFFSGYEIYDLQVKNTESFREIRTARKIVDSILEGRQILVMAYNSKFRKQNQKTIVDTLIFRLALRNNRGEDWDPQMYQSRKNATLIVLDGLCGNMIVPSCVMEPNWMQFCIIMDEKIVYTPWRDKAIDAALKSDLVPYNTYEKLSRLSNYDLMRQFFLPIETVICTGASGIKPELHQDFLTKCLFPHAPVRLGGRFVIMENPPREFKASVDYDQISKLKPLNVNEDTITESNYSKIAKKEITAGTWCAERNGAMLVKYYSGIYSPIIFKSKHTAIRWMEMKIRNDGMSLLQKDESDGIIRYECQKEDKKLEFCFLYITEKEVESYQINYYLRVLKMGEYEDLAMWLRTKDAIDQGYDPKDGLEANMNKYYNNLKSQVSSVPASQSSQEDPAPQVDRYWEKYQCQENTPTEAVPASQVDLPEDGVLFLGGHWNMVKKIQQLHPNWIYITDNEFKPYSVINVKYVFYWTNHSSHAMMENIFSKLTPDAEIMYVKATNIDLLEKEMLEQFTYNKARKRRGKSGAAKNSEV